MNTAPCVFIGLTAVVLCFVDDLGLFAANEDTWDNLYRRRRKQSRFKDLGKQKRFLELDLVWNDNESVSLRQKQLINKALDYSRMEQSIPVGILINKNTLVDEAA